jgi:hypothetical protein
MNVRYYFRKIPTFFLALIVCLGSASYSVRATSIVSQSESETVDPHEEKLVCQRLNGSRLIRQNPFKKLTKLVYLDFQGPGDLKHYVHHPDPQYSCEYHIPILRAPPLLFKLT